MQIRWLQIFLVTLMRLLTDSEPNRSHLEGAQLIQPKSPLEPGIKMLTRGHRIESIKNHVFLLNKMWINIQTLGGRKKVALGHFRIYLDD